LFQLRQQIWILVDQEQICFQFFDGRVQFLIDFYEIVQDFFFFRQLGRFLRFAPDGRISQLGVNFFQSVYFFGKFKETPGDLRFFSSIPQKDFLFVPVPWQDCKRFQCSRQGEF
jgi:hypothetical protein